MKEYIVLLWDEVQPLQDKEGFDSNSYLIKDEKGLKDFGAGSYFVNKNWYERNVPRTKEYYLKLIEELIDNVDLSNPVRRLAAIAFVNITKTRFLQKLENGIEPKEAFGEVIIQTTESMFKFANNKKE